MVFYTHITHIFPQKNCFVKNKNLNRKQKIPLSNTEKNIPTFPACRQAGAEC